MKHAIRAAAAACFLMAAAPVFAQDMDRSGPPRKVEVAFVLDTTGSMTPLIEGAKRKIWSIATSILDANPNAEVHMALVAYRDRGDDYVTKVYPLTRDIQKLYGELLAFEADGGGDWPESVNEALDIAVTKIKWTQGERTDRIVFLVGDAPPHMDYRQDRKYPDTLAIARERGIIVNAVQAGSARDTERVWRSVAQLGNGRYIPIPQDGGKVVVIETPYDREIINLQIEINRTVVPYGSRRQKAEVVGKARSVAEAPAPAASDMASYMRKEGKREYKAITGDGDLVSDVLAGKQALENLRDEERPDEWRGKSIEEQKRAIEAQAEKRKQLAAKMDELVKQRDSYIAAQAKAAPRSDSFDAVVKETLRSQIKP